VFLLPLCSLARRPPLDHSLYYGTREVDGMQLVLIAMIGAGAAVVVGLLGPLAIRAGRALQRFLGVLPEDRVKL
jgi:hypothetical protein